LKAGAAAAHVNDLVAQAAVSALGHEPSSVTDLGCGVGGSLFHLARCWPHSRLTGYTLSHAQVQIAQALAQQRHLQDQCEIRQGDFTALDSVLRNELVIAIESHTHLPSLADFLKLLASMFRLVALSFWWMTCSLVMDQA